MKTTSKYNNRILNTIRILFVLSWNGLEKNAKKMIFHFIIFKRSSFFIVILNGAKWSEKSSYFQNGKISPLRCE